MFKIFLPILFLFIYLLVVVIYLLVLTVMPSVLWPEKIRLHFVMSLLHLQSSLLVELLLLTFLSQLEIQSVHHLLSELLSFLDMLFL